jgi:fatty acid desaturase
MTTQQHDNGALQQRSAAWRSDIQPQPQASLPPVTHPRASCGRAIASGYGFAMTATAPKPTHDELVATMTGGLVREVTAFAGSDRLRPDGRPKPELRAELRKIADGRNALAVVFALIAPVAVLVAVTQIDAWWAWVLAFPIMSSLQLRMYILHHEAAHRLLFSNRRANDLIGINTLGWIPWGTGKHTYRRIHQAHHRDEFGPNEPDFLLYSFYPIVRDSFRRKLRRDATGVSAWRQVRPRLKGLMTKGRRRTPLRFFGMQAVILGVFLAFGQPLLWFVLWMLPFFTWYQVVNRLRSLGEHAGMTRSEDRRETTHIVEPTILSRLFMAPLFVGYHLPHHVDSGIPMRNLPKLQQILIEDGYVPDHIMWPSYTALWRACAAGTANPKAA